MRRAWSRRRALLAQIALGCLLFGFSPESHAAAQINTERLRPGDPRSGASASLGASAAWKYGNVSLLQLDGKAAGLYYAEPHSILLSTLGTFGQQSGERFASAAFAHLRWTAMWWSRIGSEVFAQLQYDEFLRLKLRELVGAGPRFVLVDTDSLRLAVGTGYMLEYEQLDIAQDDPHPRTTLAHRSTSYVTLAAEVTDRLQFGQTVYAQPRFDRPSDIRVLAEFELKVALNGTFALTTAFALRFDSDPPSEVDKLDLGLKNGLELTL